MEDKTIKVIRFNHPEWDDSELILADAKGAIGVAELILGVDSDKSLLTHVKDEMNLKEFETLPDFNP